MRYVIVALLLVATSLSASGAFGAAAGPRVAFGIDAKSGHRYLQLTERGPVYPTADVTCDGNRRTVTLTRSSNAADRTIAVYVVPPKISDLMLRSSECRLLLPGQEIALARQHIRAAWSTHPATATR